MTDALNHIQIFETQDGQVYLEDRLQADTAWLSTEQMSIYISRERSALTKQIDNVFKEAELDQYDNVQNLHIVYSDSNTGLVALILLVAESDPKQKTSSSHSL